MNDPEITALRRQLMHGPTPTFTRIPPPIRDPTDFRRETDYVPKIAPFIQQVFVVVWVTILLPIFLPLFLFLLLGLIMGLTGQHMPC